MGRGGSRRVLICDDEPQILRALTVLLSDAGYATLPSASAAEALDRASARSPDAAIIDLLLPDYDGVELCRRLRQGTQMPIIILSAVGEEGEKVRALEAGADDYVTKPFASAELLARLKAAMRRADGRANESPIRVDGLEIDLGARTVRQDGQEIRLTPIEYELLRILVQNRGRLMTHRTLLREVWGPAYQNDVQTLRTHISNLRRKLAAGGGRRYIRTDPGVGYRFLDNGRLHDL